MLEMLGSIPTLQSAIQVDGGDGGAVREKMDLYLTPGQLAQPLEFRGSTLVVSFREDLSTAYDSSDLS